MGRINGSCTGGSSTKYSVWIDWSENYTTVASNISNVTATLKVQRNDGYASSAYNNNAVNNVKLYVDGNCKVDNNIAIDTRNSAVVTLATWTGNITHNSDGTKQLPLSGSFTMKGASSLTGGSVSGKVTLTTIPRASTVSANNTNIGSVCKISIARASSSFTHKLYYQCSGVSKTLIAQNVGSSYDSWAVPTSLFDLIPNDISIPVTIICETYNGSTMIGSATSDTISAFVPFDYPTISSFNVYDSNSVTYALTGSSSGILVKGESTATYSISASAKNKAYIASYKVTNGNTSKTTLSGSFANVTSGDFSAVVYDSRGLPSDPVTVNKTLINYLTPLFLNLDITRPNTTSNTANLTCNGSWFNGSFGAQSNTLELKYRWRVKNGTYSSYITLSPTLGTNSFTCNVTLGTSFSFTSSYEFEFVLTDKLHTVTKTVSLLYGKPIMDIGEDDVLINGDLAVDGLSGMVKAVSGTLSTAVAGTDYATPAQVATKQNKITASGILKGNGSGTVSTAVAGTDYATPTVNLLWSGAWFMNENQTLTLSQSISSQNKGVVLVFSEFSNNTAQNACFSSHFVPKTQILYNGYGQMFVSFNTWGKAMAKYLYISDTTIKGHATNDDTGTNSAMNINYQNSLYVLRYVLGV